MRFKWFRKDRLQESPQGTERGPEIEASVVGLLLPVAGLEGSGCKKLELLVEPWGGQESLDGTGLLVTLSHSVIWVCNNFLR